MAKTTFSGPIVSKNGEFTMGTQAEACPIIAAPTTMVPETHAGKTLLISDTDTVITLPTITATTIGAKYRFALLSASTGMTFVTDGTDLFYGALNTSVSTAATAKDWYPNGSSNDTITLDGTTKGGLVNSVLEIEAVSTGAYLVSGGLKGSGTLATPFSG
tara:strand:- start:2712 stop:3191 length:480 start_codon:yes stop_codon:yes gene_type:complete